MITKDAMATVAKWLKSRTRGRRVELRIAEDLPCKISRSTLNMSRIKRPPVVLCRSAHLLADAGHQPRGVVVERS
ncbi:hypothetical protein TNCV_1111621 [Trichonephila clavipes]|nr:hypothetical protein TNCV_1111621 [Trichonephila clavipes]